MQPDLRLVTPNGLPSDDEIKEIARSDRRRAMGLIAARYRARLYHHARNIVKDHQEAFDVVQEVFIKAIHERRFFNEGFKMKAWLYRVTSNLCFNIVRNRKRRGDILDSMQRPESTSPDQVARVLAEQHQKVVQAAMEHLTVDHREILTLRYHSDLSYAEIADTLDVALGTVMSRLSRAKNKLLEAFDALGVEEV